MWEQFLAMDYGLGSTTEETVPLISFLFYNLSLAYLNDDGVIKLKMGTLGLERQPQ